MTQRYEPFGDVRKSIGSASTNYGFTGEWEDSTGLIHLRARYYNPEVGRFISKDTWEGSSLQPNSYNFWLYAYDNPINLTDPSGQRIPTPTNWLCILLGIGRDPLTGSCDNTNSLPVMFGTTANPYIGPMLNPLSGGVQVLVLAAVGVCSWLIVNAPPTSPSPVAHPDTLVQVDPFAGPIIWQAPTPGPKPAPSPAPGGDPIAIIPSETPKPKRILYHYTSAGGYAGILALQAINPSLSQGGRAAYGYGQYFTDISHTEAAKGSPYQMSRALFTMPWFDDKVTHFVAVNVEGLNVVRVDRVHSQTYGNRSIYLHRSETQLLVAGKIELSGRVLYTR